MEREEFEKIIQEAEIELKKEKTLNFKEAIDLRSSTLKSIIQEILAFSLSQKTFDSDGEYFCEPYQRRSLGDIYRLIKGHRWFPTTTLKRVLAALYELEQEKAIGSFFCDTAQKRVYMLSFIWGRSYAEMNKMKIDEYGMTAQDIADYFKPQVINHQLAC